MSNPEPEQVPEHDHITVDEETYWGLMYLHREVQTLLREGKPVDPMIAYHSNEAERRLKKSRAWNEADADHHQRPRDPGSQV